MRRNPPSILNVVFIVMGLLYIVVSLPIISFLLYDMRHKPIQPKYVSKCQPEPGRCAFDGAGLYCLLPPVQRPAYHQRFGDAK